MNDQSFPNLPPSKFDFQNFFKSTKFFYELSELFVACFSMFAKRKGSQLEKKMGRSALKALY